MSGPVAPVSPIVPVSPVGGGLGFGGGMGGIAPVSGPVSGGPAPIVGGGAGGTIGGPAPVMGPIGTSPIGTGTGGGTTAGTGGGTLAGGGGGTAAPVRTSPPVMLQPPPSGTTIHPLTAGISASAALTLVGTSGTGANETFQYAITVTNTGSTTIGTFWFSWVPGEDFLPTRPTATTSPNGWTPTLTGLSNSFDGTAIQWVAGSTGTFIQPGQSLSGFGFTTHDSPTVLAGNSPSNPTQKVLTAFVYIGAPEADPGDEIQVTENTTTPTPPAPTQVATTTTLTSSNASVVSGTNVTFTAHVTSSSGSGTPTGTVMFLENGNPIGSGNLQANGTAIFNTLSLSVGEHVLTAQYEGDANFTASNSSEFTEMVTAPVVTPPAPPAPTSAATHLSIAAQPLTTVAAGHAIGPVVVDLLEANGKVDTTNSSSVTISISGAGKLRGTMTVNALHGVATFGGLSITSAGSFTLNVVDGALAAAHTRAVAVTPDVASGRLVLLSRPAASVAVGAVLNPALVVRDQDQFGNVITSDHSKVTVSVASGSGKIAGTTSATLSNGIATVRGFSLSTAGNDVLQVTDNSLALKTPVKFNETVTRATATVPTPPVAASYPLNKAIALATTLHSNAPASVPFTGTATVVDQSSGKVLGSAKVSANGQMKLTVNGLAAGAHSVSIHYSGDANHAAGASVAFVLHVNAASTPAAAPAPAPTPMPMPIGYMV